MKRIKLMLIVALFALITSGGFVLFARNIDTPEQLKQFTADLDVASEIKPFIAVDEEGRRIGRIGRSNFSADVEQAGLMQEIGETANPQAAYDAAYTSDDLPATFSRQLLTGKLREELGYNAVVNAVKSGRISEKRSNESVRRIFALKFKEEYQD